MSKKQLNVYVDEAVDEEFRRVAGEAGFGKKPAPLIEVLLAMYRPDLPRLYSRLQRALSARESFSKEEKLYLELLRDFLTSLLAKD